MKTLIVYASKTGTTEKCAGIISQSLKDAKVVNLSHEDVDINKYDLIVIGTPIRMGMIHKKIKEFIKKNIKQLKLKNYAIYICCGFDKSSNKYFEENFNKEFLNDAIIYSSFGGEMNIEKQKGLDKFIVNVVTKNVEESKETNILNENINEFITKIKKL